MRFRELQDRFQSAIVDGDNSILRLIPDGAHENRDVLLGVYRNAYVLRLIEIMQNDHKLLHSYLGDDTFSEMARAYIAAYPSHHANARWFSRNLPKFLFETEPYSGHRQAAELAVLEKALNDAFDAADGPVIGLESLGAIVPEDWERLSFQAHSTAVRLNFDFNSVAIWSALKSEEDLPDPSQLDAPEKILVWRQENTPKFRILSAEEAMMWDEAIKGVRFGVLCELLATYADPDTAALRAAGYLQGWLAGGLLSSALVVPKRQSANRRRA